MKQIYFISLFLFTTCLNLMAKDEPVDSTLSRLLTELNLNIQNGEHQKADSCLKDAFSLDDVKKSQFYYHLLDLEATYYHACGEFETAMAKRSELVKLLPKIDDLSIHVTTYNELGVMHRMTDNFDSALVYYSKALDAAMLQKDEANIGLLGLNLAVFHANLRDYKSADTQIKKAITHIEKAAGQDFLLLNAYQTQAFIKTELGENDSSAVFVRKALALAKANQNPEWIMRCMPALVNHFERSEQLDSLQYYIKEGNRVMEELPQGSVSVLGWIQARAVINQRIGNYRDAIYDYQLMASGSGTQKCFTYERLASCYRELGDMNKAFEYMDSARMYTDTLAKADTKQLLAEYQTKYETKEKDLQISQMEQERLANEVAQQRLVILFVVLIAILILLVLYFMNKRRVAKLKVNQLEQESELQSARSYISGLENERRRLAKDLHDGIANDMLGLQMKMSLPNTNISDVAELLNDIRNNVRNISHELMPPEFTHLTLGDVIADYAYKMQRDTGKVITYNESTEKSSSNIQQETAYEVYRILQEVVSNILKHNEVSHMTISLECTSANQNFLVIEDDGNEYSTNGGNGIGLRTTRDRAKAIAAEIKFERIDNKNRFMLMF